jgi:TonB family protein
MSVRLAGTLGPGWVLAEEAERRYHRLCLRIGLPVLLLGILLPWLGFELSTPEEAETEEVMRYAQLLPQAPAPAASPVSAPAPTQERSATSATAAASPPRPSAQAVARQSGLMRLSAQLDQMRSMDVAAVDSRRPLTAGHAASGESPAASGAMLAAAAASGSGGIGERGHGRVSNSSGTGFGNRQTGSVQGPPGPGGGGGGGNEGEGARRGRSLEEIQLTFDRSKSSFFAIFNRAARESAGMSAGRIIVNLTIAPDGSVIGCDLVSSSFGNQTLEQKVLQRVRMLNFGARDVPVFNYPNYPIHFISS